MGALAGVLGVLERSWGHLGWNLGILEGSRNVLETFGDHLGVSWEALEGLLGGLGGFKGLFWKLFRRILVFLKQFMKIVKNL